MSQFHSRLSYIRCKDGMGLCGEGHSAKSTILDYPKPDPIRVNNSS